MIHRGRLVGATSILAWTCLFDAAAMGQCACPADVDGNGRVDGRDVRAFVACLLNPANGAGLTPTAGCACADLNGMLGVTTADMPAFVGILTASPGICSGTMSNDACANATPITDGVYPFDTRNATTDGVPANACTYAQYSQIDKDVWFCYIAPRAGVVVVNTCNSNFDTRLAAYNGCTCPAGANPIRCNDDAEDPSICAGYVQSEVRFPTVTGQAYLIRVGGYFGASGTGQLSVAH